MRQKLNLDTWNRKEHFMFFNQMEEPFFGVTTTIDCTKSFEKAKELGVSFFSYYLHKTLTAVNAVEEFRYRIIGDEVYIFDQINASATVLREDKTFGFSLMEYHEDAILFSEIVKNEIVRIQKTSGLFTREEYGENLIHFSALPWIKFESFSHARSYTWPDSCPKISFGKMTEENGKKTMPVSIHVHHGLIDGYHVGQFIECLEKLMNN
ncbi:CatA-like O-acetyltransferase [Flavobacterium sp.]|uniref:CatA-like O-acetyltransferase n=1 Tax=Flavobacterium sp. TaxID=239 RepID=UPI0038D225C6